MVFEAEKFIVNQDYLGGFQHSNGASRKHKYTITYDGNQFFKEVFFGEVHTKKNKNGEWGKGESTFYFDEKSPMFDTILELLRSKYDVSEPKSSP